MVQPAGRRNGRESLVGALPPSDRGPGGENPPLWPSWAGHNVLFDAPTIKKGRRDGGLSIVRLRMSAGGPIADFRSCPI